MAFAPALIAECKRNARLPAGLGDLAAVGNGIGDRLVEKDMLAGGCRLTRGLQMNVVRRRVYNGLDVLVGENGLVARRRTAAVFCGEGRALLFGAGEAGDDLELAGALDGVGRGSPLGIESYVGDVDRTLSWLAGAHNPDATERTLAEIDAAIARVLGRHRSTVGREVRRNGTPRDDCYRPQLADWYARGRRSRSRRNQRFSLADWDRIRTLLREGWSPEQVAGRLRRQGELAISHETIYRYIWADKRAGGRLYRHLRGAQKKRRKRYGRYDSRGRLAGKRPISERPPGAENRSRVGHLEGDTMIGSADKHCVLTLVDRKTGYLMLGKLEARTTKATNRRAIKLIRRAQRRVRTLTVDNGTEFHGYKDVEAATGARIYFATPHHSWERGTCENTNGLLRQYLPKRKSIAHVSQADCNRIARRLNNRPRKRLGYLTPAECYELQTNS